MVAAWMRSPRSTSLARAGFDIAHAFDAATAAREPGLAVLAGAERLGLLIGNTRALWPRFTAALRDPALAAERDPLDRYTERAIDAAFPGARDLLRPSPLRRRVRPAPAPRGRHRPGRARAQPPRDPSDLRAVVRAARRGGDRGEPPVRQPIPQPCTCDEPCATVLARAQRSGDWRDWLALRDRCSLRTWRYSDDQVHYHYATLRALRASGGLSERAARAWEDAPMRHACLVWLIAGCGSLLRPGPTVDRAARWPGRRRTRRPVRDPAPAPRRRRAT